MRNSVPLTHSSVSALRPTPFRILTGSIATVAGVLLISAVAVAQTPKQKLDKPAVEAVGPTALPEVVVTDRATPDAQVTEKLEEAREKYAGSVATVSPAEIQLQKTNNLGEILQRIPGAAYVDEDGRGTKPDIGLRGLNPIRSEYVQLLLDGTPVQPSLYSEQAAYYGPPAERIAGIEVFKGGAAVLFGPNTVGGVVNLISRPLSSDPFSAILDTRYGSYGDYSGNVFVSGTHGPIGWGVEYLHKEGDGFRDSLGFNIDDVEVRLAIKINENHSAQLRFQYYDEQSETPGGLLPKQYRSDVEQSNKHNDEFFGTRIAGDLRTIHIISDSQRIETLFYASSFERDWFLQDYVDNGTSENLTLLDQNQQFLRDFTVVGFEPRYFLKYDLGATRGHELVAGARIYYDQVNRRTAVGEHGDSREGNNRPTAEDDLTTFVLAGYLQNEFKLTSRLSIVPGIRYEHIDQTREDVFNNAPEQSVDYEIWVPGIGVKYELAKKTLLYGNVTRSFRPPSFANSFDPAFATSNADLKPTTAWTYEGGIRANPYPWLKVDLGGFYSDFEDQVVASAGVLSNFDTRTYGFEGLIELGLFGLFHASQNSSMEYTGDHEVSLLAGATFVESTFADGPFVDNQVPYVPNQTISFGIKYSYRDRFDLAFQGFHVSERFTDAPNTINEDPAGTIGVLEDYTVFDLKSRWRVSENLVLNAGINNIFDEVYSTQRRTSQQKGIFPGPTRQVYVGATLTF